jgi:hypothetical protein
MAGVSRDEAAAAREIGPLPEVVDAKRRAAGRLSLTGAHFGVATGRLVLLHGASGTFRPA